MLQGSKTSQLKTTVENDRTSLETENKAVKLLHGFYKLILNNINN